MSNDLIKKFDNTLKQIHILDSESQQGFNKFFTKANYVGEQFTTLVYQSVDPKNPTLLVLLIPFAGFVIIRCENEKIQFYDVKKFVAYMFIVILVSSAVVTPFSFSVFYWGYAFAQETPEGIWPPADPPDGFVNVPEFSDNIGIISTGNTTVTTSPVTEFNEGVVIISSNTTSSVTEFNEGVVIISSNTTSSVTEFNEGVVIISSSTTTSIVSNFTNGSVTVPPNATESWQFENDTSNVALIGDASLFGNEGINGTSLLLDGDQDFGVTNSTNATTTPKVLLSLLLFPKENHSCYRLTI
jgi:hypothetical protein